MQAKGRATPFPHSYVVWLSNNPGVSDPELPLGAEDVDDARRPRERDADLVVSVRTHHTTHHNPAHALVAS